MSESTIPIVARAETFSDRVAVESDGRAFSYARLLEDSRVAAHALLDGADDLRGRRVAFLTAPSYAYVTVQWAIWRAGGVAVPLCLSHPRPELEYVIRDSEADLLVADQGTTDRLDAIARDNGLHLLRAEDLLQGTTGPSGDLPRVDPRSPALIIYTSGTTSRPKGAVSTHANVSAQIESLVAAWDWSPEDRILLVLPLHHVHGVINVLGCALWSGARCEMTPGFDAAETWKRFVERPLTLFMAVPTIYARLIRSYDESSEARRRELRNACGKMRLMVSGSAALPQQTLDRWRDISGQVLLERYGMTEIGMALSNPLEGERRPGSVGKPLPGVEVRRLDEDGKPAADAEPAELQVRGPAVFERYWNRPRETAEAFDHGWFRTGDVAVVEDGYYRLLGRQSVDIIKTGGYKVSALEIEETLREHPAIRECAVVGLPDEEWGERVGAALVLEEDQALSLEDLRAWCKKRLAVYKVPSRLVTLPELPRNALGKVTKPDLVSFFD